MKKRTLIARLCTLLFVVCALSAQQKNRLQIIAEEAKAQGRTIAELPASILLPTGVREVNDIVGPYSVVVGEPVSSWVSPAAGDRLTTWYLIRVVEVLLKQSKLASEPLAGAELLSAMLPISPDYILVPAPGGDLLLDDVLLRQFSKLQLRTKQTYLLVLYFDSTGRAAELAAQEAGVFAIGPGDGSLHALSDSPLARDIKAKWNSKIDAIGSFLRAQVPPSR
jgi:hypothetical protein